MKYFLIGFFIACGVIIMAYYTKPAKDVDQRTKVLCMEYALKDHEKEFTPERWAYIKTFMADPNEVEFWYKSCINHTRYPVGGTKDRVLKCECRLKCLFLFPSTRDIWRSLSTSTLPKAGNYKAQ